MNETWQKKALLAPCLHLVVFLLLDPHPIQADSYRWTQICPAVMPCRSGGQRRPARYGYPRLGDSSGGSRRCLCRRGLHAQLNTDYLPLAVKGPEPDQATPRAPRNCRRITAGWCGIGPRQDRAPLPGVSAAGYAGPWTTNRPAAFACPSSASHCNESRRHGSSLSATTGSR